MDRRRTPSLDVAVPDILRRQLGALPTRNFARRIGAPEDLVLRFEKVKWLERHDGCVNTVSFSPDGDILASGSDDTTVILWNWQAGEVEHRFHSGHIDNVFQAKFMPFSGNRSIVTSSADGEVRHAQILESGEVETVMVAQHEVEFISWLLSQLKLLPEHPVPPIANFWFRCRDDVAEGWQHAYTERIDKFSDVVYGQNVVTRETIEFV